MRPILKSILATAALTAAFLPGHAQAGRVCTNALPNGGVVLQGALVDAAGRSCLVGVRGVAGTPGSFVFVDGRHVRTRLFGTHRSRHFRRIVVIETPFVVPTLGVVRAVRVPAVAVPTGSGFVILNGGFAATGINGFTTGSIGPFTTFSNSFGAVPLVTRVVPATGARVALGRGVGMAGRR